MLFQGFATPHWEINSPFPHLEPGQLMAAASNGVRQKWCSVTSKSRTQKAYSFLTALPFRTLVLGPQPPSCEESQGTWRSHVFPSAALVKVTANNQHQLLDVWKERPSNHSNPQFWSLHLVEKQWMISANIAQIAEVWAKELLPLL